MGFTHSSSVFASLHFPKSFSGLHLDNSTVLPFLLLACGVFLALYLRASIARRIRKEQQDFELRRHVTGEEWKQRLDQYEREVF